MYKYKKIGIDLDGCIFDFISGYNKVALEMYKITLPPYNRETYPPKWDWMKDTLTKEQDKEIRKKIRNSSTFWEELPVYPWAQNLGQYLRCSDEVYFITSRTGNGVKYQSEASLQNLRIGSPTVLVVPFGLHKANIVNALDLDIMIEDKPETLTSLVFSCPRTIIYRVIQPWNIECVGQPIYDLRQFFHELYMENVEI